MRSKLGKRDSEYLHYQDQEKISKVNLSNLLRRIKDQKLVDRRRNLVVITAIISVAIIFAIVVQI